MSDDITFCGSECNNTKCRRHRSNIKEPQYPHSVALLKGTEYCEKKHKPTSVRLIDAEALRNEVDTWGCNDYDKYDFLDAIDNAPTVERPQGECEKCDYRKFTENFIDDVVDWMDRYGITSIEQLSEILKGGAE